MGQFSWTDCKNNKRNIKIGEECYLLIPKAFRDEYGERIHASYYDGYGNIGYVDVYEMIAIFNRQYITDEIMDNLADGKPVLERFGGLWESDKDRMRKDGKTEAEIEEADLAEKRRWYDMAVNRYKTSVNRLNDYRLGKLSDNRMEAKYGADWLREIGIDIGCYDRQQKLLKYPVKITHDATAVYEKCRAFSHSDERQGC